MQNPNFSLLLSYFIFFCFSFTWNPLSFFIPMHVFRIVYLKLNVGKRSSIVTTRHKAAFIYTFFRAHIPRFLSLSYYRRNSKQFSSLSIFFSLASPLFSCLCAMLNAIHFVSFLSSLLRFQLFPLASLLPIFHSHSVYEDFCIMLISTSHTLRYAYLMAAAAKKRKLKNMETTHCKSGRRVKKVLYLCVMLKRMERKKNTHTHTRSQGSGKKNGK